MDIVEIQKRKLIGGTGTWSAYVLDRDDFGTWFFAPRGTHTVHRPPMGRAAQIREWGGTRGPCDALTLAPSEGAYVAHWSQSWNTTIDVGTPLVTNDGVWSYTDLEVDLFLTRDGTRGIVDLHELFEMCDRGLIDDATRERALRTAAEVERLLHPPREPFAAHGWALFDRAVALHLEPLRRA